MLDIHRSLGSTSDLSCSRSSMLRSAVAPSGRRLPSRRQPLTVEARAARGDRRSRAGPPPDLPSLLFDQRIVYLGMPVRPHHRLEHCCPVENPSELYPQLVPAVTELMVAELLYLEKQGNALPIEMLINSSGTTRQDGEIVGAMQDDGLAAKR